MIIGLLTIRIYLPFSRSLKDKRGESNALKRKLQNKFNISIIESDHQELLQTLTLSVAALAGDTRLADSILDHVLEYTAAITQGEITSIQRELL